MSTILIFTNIRFNYRATRRLLARRNRIVRTHKTKTLRGMREAEVTTEVLEKATKEYKRGKA